MVAVIFKVAVYGILVSIVIGLIGTVSFSWTLNTSTYLQGLANFLHIIYYVIPIGKLSPIIFCYVAFTIFKIVIAVIKTIWQIFPVRG